MSLTFEEAFDDMADMFKAAWDTTNLAAAYEDLADDDPLPKGDASWARFSVRHEESFQASMGAALNQRQFRRRGTITVQIFTPSGKGLSERLTLAKVVSDAFEGRSSPGGVWFKNVKMNEIGRDGYFFQTNVLINFEYDEVK